jgi:hypothetical protein
VRIRERAHHPQQLGKALLARGSDPEHVRELADSHLNADAGQEPNQHRAGQEIRHEPEPGQPGEQEQPADQQGRHPGQPDVSLRPGHRQAGEGGGEDDGGCRVGGHDEVA